MKRLVFRLVLLAGALLGAGLPAARGAEQQ